MPNSSSSVREVILSLSIAVCVVIAVIFLSMGVLRLTLIPVAAIPIALIGTVAAIWLLGFSVNILTLLALVLATGMIVDDAIVVVENIQRQRKLGMKAYAASVSYAAGILCGSRHYSHTRLGVPADRIPAEYRRKTFHGIWIRSRHCGCDLFICRTVALPNVGLAPTGRALRIIFRPWPFRLPNWCRVPLYFGIHAKRSLARDRIRNRCCVHRNRPLSDDRQKTPSERRPRCDYHNDARPRRRQPRLYGPAICEGGGTSRAIARLRRSHEHSIDRGTLGHQSQLYNRPACTLVRAWQANSTSRANYAPPKGHPGATARIRTPNSLNLKWPGGQVEFTLTGSDYRNIAAAADEFVDVMRRDAPELEDIEIEFQQFNRLS